MASGHVTYNALFYFVFFTSPTPTYSFVLPADALAAFNVASHF
jgi:hypothetical protein